MKNFLRKYSRIWNEMALKNRVIISGGTAVAMLLSLRILPDSGWKFVIATANMMGAYVALFGIFAFRR